MDCAPLLKRRQACYDKHSLSAADWHMRLSRTNKSVASSNDKRCLISTLAAKRCLAFQKCELEALHYYGTPHDSVGPKALCASFEEGFCFGNPQIMNVDADQTSNDREQVFAHHQKAKRRVVNNKQKFRACQDISERMHNCLNKAMQS